MAAPTSNRPRSPSPPQQIVKEKEFDPVDEQINILKKYASSENPNPKQLQSVYQSTIMLCLTYNKRPEALALLNESETEKIFAGSPEARAKLFSAVVCNLIANGSHAEGYSLYKGATSFGVWNDKPDQPDPNHKKAKEKLAEAGFKLEG